MSQFSLEPTNAERPAEPQGGGAFCVRAPSRLHFGLLSFGVASARQFGGLGVMLRDPGLRLAWSPAAAFDVSGPLADRVRQAAEAWSEFYHCPLPAAQVRVLEAPPQHVGLGVGTQLALTVACGLHAWLREPLPPPAQMAASVRRGRRSAIGVYGFFEGGLIAERGKLPDELLSPLDCRLDLPSDWSVVLARPRGVDGLSGPAEQAAFQHLPPVSGDVTSRLFREAQHHLLPAAAAGDFAEFSASVYRYGREAGACFAPLQGGPYNGPLLTELVDCIRALGVAGVGQSSWGPTIYAFLPDPDAARRCAARLPAEFRSADLELIVTQVDNEGARVTAE